MIEQICQTHHYQREVLEKEGRSLSGAEAARMERYAGISQRSASAGHRRRPNFPTPELPELEST